MDQGVDMKKHLLIFLFSLVSSLIQGTMMESFSLKELQCLQDFRIKKPNYIKASDSIDLAYYSFVPSHPKAIVVFYHGTGFWNSALYQYFAKQLAEKHNIGCYLFDIRGHGNSQGVRGDAPNVNQVWDDVTSAIDFVKKQHPEKSLYLGGHSSGGALVLNYSNYNYHPLINGYLFIAPYLGRNSGVIKEHADQAASFVKSVRVWVFILNGISGGYFFAHTPAVYFNHPDELLKKDSLIVKSYTPTMMAATAPENPQELFTKIDKPFALMAAQNDEQFMSDKLLNYKNLASTSIVDACMAEIVPNAKHLDIMLQAANYCATFINKQ